MIGSSQRVYIFRGATPDQVDDLCDLWQESVVEYSREQGVVQVETDPISINQFTMLYGLYQYLEHEQPIDVQAGETERHRKPQLCLV